jgi:hypothetical protein
MMANLVASFCGTMNNQTEKVAMLCAQQSSQMTQMMQMMATMQRTIDNMQQTIDNSGIGRHIVAIPAPSLNDASNSPTAPAHPADAAQKAVAEAAKLEQPTVAMPVSSVLAQAPYAFT